MSCVCLAQEGQTDAGKQKAILNLSSSVADYFAKIASISFKSSLKYTLDPKLITPGMSLGRQAGTFAMELKGDKFIIEDRMNIGPEAEQFDRTVAYDGEKYQIFDELSRVLWIKTFKPTDPKPEYDQFRFDNFFLQTFEFFSSKISRDYESSLDLRELQTKECLDLFIKRIISVDATSDSNSKITATISGGIDENSKLPVTYIVEFSTRDGFFPKGWKRVDEQHRTLSSFEVNEAAVYADSAGRRFTYPSEVTYSEYGGGPGQPLQASPRFTKKVKINDFKINFSDEDQNAFEIDPAMASVIRDADHGVAIRVPK